MAPPFGNLVNGPQFRSHNAAPMFDSLTKNWEPGAIRVAVVERL